MRLQVGERLEGAGPENQPGGYVVTGVVRETPWYGLYTGKKVFYNFDFTAKRLRETDEVEWLDVFLRTVRYPILDDAHYVNRRRALARGEVRLALGNRRSNLWPEPIDLLEVENLRDPFAFSAAAQDSEPVAVFARPHGRFTEDWQRQVLPVRSLLAVLAELLEFVRQAHDDGLLLQGLGPGAILIDDSDRVHYLGSDMALSRENPLLRGETATAEWARLFPPERFPLGFAAPECFQPGQRPDPRSDLYAWGLLLYALVSGHSPAHLARAQGRPWTQLRDEHFSRVSEVLSDLPAGAVRTWAEQLGVPAEALAGGWPGNLVAVLRLLTSPDPQRRPRSVAELRAWLVDLPPPTIAHLVALHVDAGVARILVDCSALGPELQLRVQRGLSAPPATPQEGTNAYDGPLRPVALDSALPLTPEPIFYTVFTWRHGAKGPLYSAGTAAALWQPTPANVRRWVEQQVTQTDDVLRPPPHVAMVLAALEAADAADALLSAPRVPVRGWALWRLRQGIREGMRQALADPLLWRLVRDPSAALRPAAALTYWENARDRDDELLLRLLEALEATPVDAPVSLAEFLRELGLDEAHAGFLLRRLEEMRPTECPLCHLPIPLRERADHLRTVHGYLDVDGDVLPADVARARLWDRALGGQDRQAHERLIQLYLEGTTGGAERYVADLDKQLLGPARLSQMGGTTVPVALPFGAYATLVAVLRQSPYLPLLTPLLLRSHRPRLRELGLEALVPVLADRLGGTTTGGAVGQALEEVCPGLDLVDQKLILCDRLSLAGVEQGALSDCAARLREDRLTTCPECDGEVRTRDVEIHLRRAHGIFEFRGARGSEEEIRAAILRAACTAPPDPAAWRNLQALVQDQHPGEIDRFVVVWLFQHLKATSADERGKAVVGLAETIVTTGTATRLLPLLVGPGRNTSYEQLGKRIGLEVCARLEPAPALEIVPVGLPLLADRTLSRRSRENAAMALLRATGKAGPQALDVLHAYVAGSGKLRALQKLVQLEQRFGQAPAITELALELDSQVRMTCPRCPTQLRKKDMVRHLWDRHHLVLDGQCVREPWRVLEDWAVDYALEKEPALLARCRELAQRADPEAGLPRLYRLLFRHGVRDPELLAQMQTQARRQQASLCPYCFSHVPAEPSSEPAPLTFIRQRLEGHGYRIELSERGLIPELHIESPAEILYQGREPRRGVTRLGGLVLLVVPLVIILYLALDRLTGGSLPALLLLFVIFGLGLFVTGLLYISWPSPPPVRERLLRAAWNVLVPELLEDGTLGRPEWAFLRALVELSEQYPHTDRAPDVLPACCDAVARSIHGEPLGSSCLAALCRLHATDLRRAGADGVAFLAAQGSECFRGKRPLSFLAALLDGLRRPRDDEWGPGAMARLQLLLAQEAFFADVDLDDWLALGRAFPTLGVALGLANRWQWLQRYVVWADKNRRPWARVGAAVSVYDLAERPEQERLLNNYPDLLLYAPRGDILLGSKGVWYQGICIGTYGPGMDVYPRRTDGEHPYEVVVGSQVIPCARHPRESVEELERWLQFYFLEFLPRLPGAPSLTQQSPHVMWQTSKIACPSCGKAVVPCVGDVGIGVR